MSRRSELFPGSVLGRYELVLKVEDGIVGELWAARLKGSRGFQKLVAIKALVPGASNEPDVEQVFLDEAALAARIEHPNVVHVSDLGEDDDVLYQVMEWVSGASLGSVLRTSIPRDVLVSARIVSQICAGLHAAHELRGDDGTPLALVHCDVSPENIIIGSDGLAKLVGFDVAKYAGRGVAAAGLVGNVLYMAPEYILGQPVDRRADVFALGVLFYELVSGVHPFLEDDVHSTLTRISSPDPPAPLKGRVPALPDAVGDIVAAALAKSREDRPATAADLMRALERALPDCALQSSNQLVADHLREAVGEQIEARSGELREALDALDDGSETPAASVRGARSSHPRAPVGMPAVLGEAGTPQATPGDLRPEPPPGQEPSVSGVSNTLDLGRDAEALLAARLRPAWLGKRTAVAAASAVFVLAVAAIVVTRGGSEAADPAPASAPELAPRPERPVDPPEAPATLAPQATAPAAAAEASVRPEEGDADKAKAAEKAKAASSADARPAGETPGAARKPSPAPAPKAEPPQSTTTKQKEFVPKDL